MYQLFTARGTEGRGDSTGMTIVSGEPFAETECALEAKKLANLWLFDHPDDTVYLAEDRRIREWLRNPALKRSEHWQSKYYRTSAVYISHILFLVTYIIAQACHDYGWPGLISIIGAAAFYELLWRLGIQNEIESAVATEMAYLLFLFALPIYLKFSQSHG